MKNLKIAVALALITTLLLGMARFDTFCTDIKSNILRLHIVANSDDEADQVLKLKVRDAILEESKGYFEECSDLEKAKEYANENLENFKEIAKKVVTENGYDYEVTATLSKADFDTRVYDNFTLPAGRYEAVNVVIGSGKGKNWWCVMFPAVCVSAAADFKGVLKDGSIKVTENADDYKIAFKSVEIYEKIKKHIIG